MIAFKCPHCDVVDGRPEYMAGQKTVCGYCHKPGVVPKAELALLAAKPEPLASKQATKPWYYGFLGRIAWLLLIISIAGLAISFAFAFAGFVQFVDEHNGLMLGLSFVGFLYSLTGLTFAALIFLVLDVARSVHKLSST